MTLGGVDTNGLLLDLKARHADHRGGGRTAGSITHSDKCDALHVKILTDHRGRGRTTYLMMSSEGAGTHLAKMAMSDHLTDGLTLASVVRHIRMAVGVGESKAGVANLRREDGSQIFTTPLSLVIG